MNNMSDTSKCSGRSTKSTSVQMQGLLNEFKLLYQNRLKKLELQEPHNEETIKLKIKTLESYINDLLEQNDVLIQTIDELEKEANSRVAKLEAKVNKSNSQYKDMSYRYKDLEKDFKSLNGRNETLERELKNKAENIYLLEREMSRLKASYEEAVKTLASKTKSDDSALMNMSAYQNEAHLKNLEDSLSTAVKSKNELIYELKEQDKRIVSLQHHNSELQHILYDKDEEIKSLEDNLNQKIDSLKKLQYPSQNECKLHRDFMQLELEKEDIKLKLANMNHDVTCLLTAFNAAKTSGKFELKNLFLKEISLDRLSGLGVEETNGTKRVHFADQNPQGSGELLKAELQHSEEIIASLKQELNSLRSQYESLLNGKEIALNTIKSTLSTEHNKGIVTSGQIFEKDMEIRKFKNELCDLKSQLNICTEENEYKKNEIKECKMEINDFLNEVKNLRSEIMCKDQQIYNLKEKLHEQTLELTANTHGNQFGKSPAKFNNSQNLTHEEIRQFENRIKELKASLEESHREKYKLVDELNQQQARLKSNLSTAPVGLESLKFELKTRDDIIQKLRQEVLILQEKRDQIYSELDSQSAKFSQLECRLFFKEEENNHLTTRFKQCQKEVQDWKKSYEEEHIRNETNAGKFNMYDDSLNDLKAKYSEAQAQNIRLTASLQNLQSGSKETREKLSEELLRKEEAFKRLQEEKSVQDVSIQSQLREKLAYITKLTEELDAKNQKLDNQSDKLSQASHEASMLKKKCEEQDKELANFRYKLNENQLSSNSHLNSITSQLVDKEDQLNKVQEENSRRLLAIEQLEKELMSLQGRYESAIKEIGRLESRLQSHQYDFQNDNKMLEMEIQKRDDKFYQLKHEKDSLHSQIASLEDKLKDYELVISSLKQQNLSYQCSFKTKEDQIHALEKQIEEYRVKFKKASDDLHRLEEKNNSKLCEFTTVSELKKELECKIEQKNSLICQLREQNKNSEIKLDELRQKLIQKEDSVQKISVEIERVKSLLQSKSKECQQKIELSQTLEATLNKTEDELVCVKKTLESEKARYDTEIRVTENELDKAKELILQLSDQIKEVKYERDEFKRENLNLTSKLQLYSEEKLNLSDKNQQLEMKLLSSMEKNKFCQSEVMSRDQSLINLRSEFQLVDEKYQSAQQELKIQQEEIERLSGRVKNLQHDVKEVQAINDHMDTTKSGLENMLKQKDYDIEVLKQDLVKQERQLENVKADWTASIRNHEEEVRGYKQNFQNLNEELAHTKNDLVEFMQKINMLKAQVADQNADLQCRGQENERLKDKLRQYELLIKEQEKRIKELGESLAAAKNQVEKANNQVENLCLKVNDLEHKEDISNQQLDKYERNFKDLQENIIELKFRACEQEQQCEKLTSENKGLNRLLQDKNAEIKQLVDKCQGLNEDLDKMNFDLSKMESNLSQSEATCKLHFTKLTEKIEDVNELDKELSRVQDDYRSYQHKYQYTGEDIASRENRANQLEYELEESQNQCHLLKSQNSEVMSAISSAKADYEQLLEMKRNCGRENARLESCLSELQMTFTSTQQQLKNEIGQLEAHANNLSNQLQQASSQIESLTKQIDAGNDASRKLENQVANMEREIVSKNEEIERSSVNMKFVKEANMELERANREKEALIGEHLNDKEHMKNEVSEARHQLQHCLAEKAHVEERFMLISKNLEQIQEEIRQKVCEYVRVEQLSNKQQTEIKTLKDRTASYEEELAELKKFCEKLKKDLFANKEELINAHQDMSKTKNCLLKSEHELSSAREQEKILTEQLVQNDHLLQQLHADVRNERSKVADAQRNISQLKQELASVGNDKDGLDKLSKELANKVKERELKLQTCQAELDTTQQLLRSCKEDMAEKEGQSKVLKMNLDSSEKQRCHFIDEIHKYEEAVGQFKCVIDSSHHKYKQCHSELVQCQQQVLDLKAVVSTGEFNNKETLKIVAEKSQENAQLKSELCNARKQAEEQAAQAKVLEDRLETAKAEFQRAQQESLQFQHRLKDYEQETYEAKQQLQATSDKVQLLAAEMACKDEQLLQTRCDLQAVTEKLNFKVHEADRYQAEVGNLASRCQFYVDEQKKLEASLDKSRENGERLHKESEMVISNVNSWVHEQRNNSEKLAIKIREQATAIVFLNTEKEKLGQEIESLQHHVRLLTQDKEASVYDKEKIKALQNHLAQQQALLHQLQGRLKEHETKAYHDNTEGSKAVEELQNRLRSNIESITILNHQVNNLQRENMCTKESLEKERAARQTLQLQLESKKHFINSYTTPSPKKCNLAKSKSNRNDSPDDVGYLSSPSRSSSNVRASLRDKNGSDGSDFNADSDYWKQKAGELSMQLEQTKKFWSSRVESMQNRGK